MSKKLYILGLGFTPLERLILLRRSFLTGFILSFCLFSFIFAQEQITITTYYPSPYGSYRELRAQRMAVGNTYINRSVACWDPPCPGGGLDISDNATRDIDLIVEGSVGIGTVGPSTSLNIYNSNESTTLTNFTQAVTSAGLLITTDYRRDAYTPGLFWSTENDNPTKPKAGIWLIEDGSGTDLYFGTSNSYNTGITNSGLVLDQDGNVGIGTAGPLNSLHVDKDAGSSALATFYSRNTDGYGVYIDTTDTGNDKYALKVTSDSGSTNGLIVTNAGRVGIGMISPQSRLVVQGESSASPLAALNVTNSATTSLLFVRNDGNVGIGATSPTAKLDVRGNIKAILNSVSGSDMEYNSTSDEIGYDVAELFETNEKVEPGDVLSIDQNGNLKKSSEVYDSKVVGIVSEAPAIIFEGNQLQVAPKPFEFKSGKKPPVALVGRVKCKVTIQAGGPIKRGDLLVTSSKPGYAMKGSAKKIQVGNVLGKALEPLDKGDGKITVLVTLQ